MIDSTIALEENPDLSYNRPLICQNEPINHTHATVHERTDSELVFLRKPVGRYWNAAEPRGALVSPFRRELNTSDKEVFLNTITRYT